MIKAQRWPVRYMWGKQEQKQYEIHSAMQGVGLDLSLCTQEDTERSFYLIYIYFQ